MELENLEEATNNCKKVLIYVPFTRQTYLCVEYDMTQRMTIDQYTMDPQKILTKDMATKDTMWIHTSMT
jgi:hypothetical protein